METYYERSLRSKYRSQGVQTSFYESTPSPTNSLGDKISTGPSRDFGHAGTNHPYAPKERDNGGASKLTRVLLERFPGKEGFRRVASSYRSKESKLTHSRPSFPYVHDKLCSKLRRKRRLRVQDRSAGCVLSCTDPSKQQEVPQVRLRKQGVPISSTVFWSKYCPSSFYSSGAHGGSIPAPSGGFGDTLSGRLVNSPPGPSNLIPTSGSANRYARPGRLHSESQEIRAGPYSGSSVPRNPFASGPRESFTSSVQGWGDSRLRAPSILPQSTRLPSSVPFHGRTQLGLRSYPSGSFVPETPSTSFSFVRSDKPVYATAPIRPCGPCQPTAAMDGPTFSYLRNPDPSLSGGLHHLHGRLQSGLGRSHGRFQGFGFLDPYRPQAPHQLSGAQGGYARPTALGSSASGPPCYGRHGQFDSSFIYQQAGRDSLPFPVTLDCRSSPLVRGTRYSSPGETHSRLPERDSRPPISSKSANFDRVVPSPQDRESHLQGLGHARSRHVCDTVELPPSSVHVSSPGAESCSGGCSVSRLAGEVNVHVSSFSPAQHGHAEAAVHSGGRGDSRSPLVAVSTMVSTPTTSLCGKPVDSPIPSRSSVPAGPEVHLRRKVIPSARMEALMRHYKATGFSDEVSRLAAAPRRPSTNRMYDDRWGRFTRWAAGQGVDPLNPTAAQVASFLFDLFDTHGLSPQTVKGYRTCIGSVLNRTGKTRVVLHRTISDMIASMELQRPRATPVLPQWDLGIVLEALSKPPYEPLREASFKHLTLKTVFLLAMASAGRRSELHALRFDQNYIQFKPKGSGVTLYFSPEFMRKNQKPNQVNDPWFIPAIPTGKPEFGAPNCPVRALRYYHRYLTEHPEVRKDRRRLFVPIKDNNAGKELSAPSISRWICTTIVDSHAAVQDSKNLSGSVKAHEVRAVATSLQLFNKADLHSVMKAGRWSSGGTFTSFYLRDLCPQAESLQRAGPIVAAGEIVKISTF